MNKPKRTFEKLDFSQPIFGNCYSEGSESAPPELDSEHADVPPPEVESECAESSPVEVDPAGADPVEEISLTPVYCNIPGRGPIEIIRSYTDFASYYPNCEIHTKGWFVRNAQPDWVIFDCGANVGYYSILFSQLASQGLVYSFEPTSTYELLQQNLAHNHCKNVRAMQIGLAKESGKREDKVFRIWGQEADLAEFDFVSIDDFVRDQKIERIDCLKIDVDSYDFEVLQGAEETIERLSPWIVIEVNYALRKRGVDEAAVYKWLAERGYTDALVLDGENIITKRGTAPQLTDPRSSVPFKMWL